jgi:hypothetical protein
MTLPGDEPVTDRQEDSGPDQGPFAAPASPPPPAAASESPSAPASESPPPAAVPESPPAAPTMPGALAIVGRGLDLNVAASAEIRRASIYVGLLSLLSLGPIAAVLWAFSVSQGGFEWLQRMANGLPPDFVPVWSPFGLLFGFVLLIGFVCFLSVTVDAQLLATILIGARATGRRFDLHAALALARLRYWRLVRASFLIGVILAIPRFVINQVVMNGQPGGTEAQALIVTAIDILVSAPFAYIAAGIVLGGVGARESVRRSWRLARARWRLALLIGIVNTAVTYVAGFAIGAGGDILIRLGTAFGLGTTMGPVQIVVLAAILTLAIVSIGSLIMTIGALTVGPQIVAFLGLTGYARGLDALNDPNNPSATPRVESLISWPMQLALVINAALTVLAVIVLR